MKSPFTLLIVGIIVLVAIFIYAASKSPKRTGRMRMQRAGGGKKKCQCRNANSNIIWNVTCAESVGGTPVTCQQCCAAHEREGTFKW